MRRIALVTDGQGWIVDRISRIYQRHIAGIELFYLSALTAEGLIHLSRTYDLIHFNNFFVRGLQPFFAVAPKPTIVSIRSFRYPDDIPPLTPTLFHVIHPDLAERFHPATFIPDGIDLDAFRPARPFRVGIAYQPGHGAFKGVDLLVQAAAGLEVELVQATNLTHGEMTAFYRSLDLYVCASESEGFAAPVAECLAMNIPVMSTRTGVASYLPGLHVVERSVAGLREGLLHYLTRRKVADLAWPRVCAQVEDMYDTLLQARG